MRLCSPGQALPDMGQVMIAVTAMLFGTKTGAPSRHCVQPTRKNHATTDHACYWIKAEGRHGSAECNLVVAVIET